MKIWTKPFNIDDMTESRTGTMASFLGIEFIEIGDDFVRARMPVDERTKQPMGIMHGGASCVLAETVASVAAQYCVTPPDEKLCVGLEINTSHVKMANTDWVLATAKAVHIGQSTQLWEIEIHNEKNQLVSLSRLRLAVLNKKAEG